MSVKVGVVMDPIESIKPYKDTTLALLLAAQARDWSIAYLEMKDLHLRDGVAYGRMTELGVRDDNHDWFELGSATEGPLADLDLILMRKDPPVDPAYIYATYILEQAEQAGVLVANHPQSLRDCNEKLYAAQFPQCCAPTLVDANPASIKAFIAEQGKAVLKPLGGMGGASIFVLADGDPNTNVVIETLTQGHQDYILAQRYLPEISKGDKRILMIDGEPAIPYALARIPQAGETRGNLAAGGRGEGVPLSERDLWICEQVGPSLRERGLYFVGLDVIGDYLTEINVTSPTCVRELDKIYDLDIAGLLLDSLEHKLQ